MTLMTLEEAIKHAEEVADGHDRIKKIKAVTLEECKCADEHRQLAEWLKELKQLREQTRWIPISEGLPEDSGEYLVSVKVVGDEIVSVNEQSSSRKALTQYVLNIVRLKCETTGLSVRDRDLIIQTLNDYDELAAKVEKYESIINNVRKYAERVMGGSNEKI